MIRRFGYRRLLPVFITFVHISLALVSSLRENRPMQSWSPPNQSPQYRLVGFQQQEGEVGWDLPKSARLGVPIKMAIALNLPAVLAAAPIPALLHHEGDISLMYISSFFVPPLWYGIGRWIDVRLGYIERAISFDSTLRKIGRALALIGEGLFLLVSLCIITPMNHHRTGDTYWTGAAMICWSGFFLAAAVLSRRGRASIRGESH